MHLAVEDLIFFLLSTLIVFTASELTGISAEVVEAPRTIPDTAGIVRGVDAIKGDWRWQVYIELGNGQNRCGGSVLNDLWVVTAAHCFNRYKPTKVIAGTLRLRTPDVGAIITTVANITCHEDYNTATFENDICLIKLSAPLSLGGSISKVLLPSKTSGPIAGARCQVAGWGLNETRELPDHLQEATLTVFEQANCQKLYGSFVVPTSHFCAGNPGVGPGPDTCGGDSGGPLVCQENNKLVLHGITSFGPKNCGNDRRPGAYTRVVDYLQWIEDKTENYNWAPWISSPCSVTCGSGIKKMVRKCFNSRGQVISDNSKCKPGLAEKEEMCFEETCNVNHWGAWLPSPCSVTCGYGERHQKRICLNENDEITDNGNCQPGMDTRVEHCTGGECAAINPELAVLFWGQWDDWSTCSSQCGGFRSRTRECWSWVFTGIYRDDSYFCELYYGGNDEEITPCEPDQC